MTNKLTAAFEAALAELGSDASRRAYRSDWAAFTAWLKRQKLAMLKVGPKDVKRYLVGLATAGKAAKTRGRALSVIREVYRAFVAEELLVANPAREVKDTKRGKATKPVTWLDEEQLAKMLAFGSFTATSGNATVTPTTNGLFALAIPWTDRRDRMCIQLLAGTGRRRSEVARMQVEDFTEDGVTGLVKGGAEKTAPVPLWLKREISDWCAFARIKSGALLPRSTEDESSISGDMVYHIVKRVAKAVGIPPEKVSSKNLCTPESREMRFSR